MPMAQHPIEYKLVTGLILNILHLSSVIILSIVHEISDFEPNLKLVFDLHSIFDLIEVVSLYHIYVHIVKFRHTDHSFEQVIFQIYEGFDGLQLVKNNLRPEIVVEKLV